MTEGTRCNVITSIASDMYNDSGSHEGENWDPESVGELYCYYTDPDTVKNIGLPRPPTYEEIVVVLLVAGIRVPGVCCKLQCTPDVCVAHTGE